VCLGRACACACMRGRELSGPLLACSCFLLSVSWVRVLLIHHLWMTLSTYARGEREGGRGFVVGVDWREICFICCSRLPGGEVAVETS